jgi:hypothetical protein
MSLLAVAAAAAAGGCKGSGSSSAGGAGRSGQAARKPSGGYLDAVLGAKRRAETVADMNQMRVLGVELTRYAISHDQAFPADLKELGRPDLLRAPGAKGQAYKYISGQAASGSAMSSILIYEEQPVHDGKVLVLRVDGSVEALTPEQLAQALAATRTKLR